VTETVQINFDVLADLRKWPSANNERITNTDHPSPYLIFAGTLDECMREFVSKPASQHHLYEIHTAPQGTLVSAILLAEHIIKLDRQGLAFPTRRVFESR
jgi:hypothetical protein